MTRPRLLTTALLALVATIVLAGCAASPSPSTTTVTQKKTLAQPEGHYEDLITLAVTANQDYRVTIERTLAEKLIDRGFQVSRLADDDLPWGDVDKLTATVTDLASRAGADGILVTTLVRKDEEKNYVPTQVIQKPMVVGVGAHAQTYMDTTVAPGYYEDRKVYVLKTTLFDVQSGKAVWELYSNTVNPGSLQQAARDYAVAVAEVLNQDISHSE